MISERPIEGEDRHADTNPSLGRFARRTLLFLGMAAFVTSGLVIQEGVRELLYQKEGYIKWLETQTSDPYYIEGVGYEDVLWVVCWLFVFLGLWMGRRNTGRLPTAPMVRVNFLLAFVLVTALPFFRFTASTNLGSLNIRTLLLVEALSLLVISLIWTGETGLGIGKAMVAVSGANTLVVALMFLPPRHSSGLESRDLYYWLTLLGNLSQFAHGLFAAAVGAACLGVFRRHKMPAEETRG